MVQIVAGSLVRFLSHFDFQSTMPAHLNSLPVRNDEKLCTVMKQKQRSRSWESNRKGQAEGDVSDTVFLQNEHAS